MAGMLLMVHSLVRWLVLAALAVRAARGIVAWQMRAPWTNVDRLVSLAAMILTDVQLSLGLIVFATSPTIQGALADPGGAMKDGAIRLRFVEHPVMMVVGVILVHVAYAIGKRSGDDARRHRVAGLLTLVALLVILARIPW